MRNQGYTNQIIHILIEERYTPPRRKQTRTYHLFEKEKFEPISLFQFVVDEKFVYSFV